MYDDLHAGDLVRRAVHRERDDGDDGEQREQIAEQADDLRVPHAPHHVDAQHVAGTTSRTLARQQLRWSSSGQLYA